MPLNAELAVIYHYGYCLFYLEALNEAVRAYGAPEIFNTVQSVSRRILFTNEEFNGALKSYNTKISMDGKAAGRIIHSSSGYGAV